METEPNAIEDQVDEAHETVMAGYRADRENLERMQSDL